MVLSACKKEALPTIKPTDPEEVVIPNQEIVTSAAAFQFDGKSQFLFPAWILQVDGVREYYISKSGEAKTEGLEQLFNNDLILNINSLDEDSTLKIKMLESSINYESDYYLEIKKSEKAGSNGEYSIPVDWKYDVLVKNEKNLPILLRWEIYDGDTLLQSFSTKFNVQSIHSIGCNISLSKDDYKKYSELGLGCFEIPQYYEEKKTNSDTTYIAKDAYSVGVPIFLMGIIDESSTALNQMRKEILEDPELSSLFLDNQGFLGDQAADYEGQTKALVYWILKNKVSYSLGYPPKPYQTFRTIEEIISSRQAFCAEIAIMCAAYFSSLDYDIYLDFVPSHAVNRLIINKEEIPLDFTILINDAPTYWSNMSKYGLSTVKESVLKKVKTDTASVNLFEQEYRRFVEESESDSFWKYKKGQTKKEQKSLYGSVNVKEAREYLPIFSCGDYHSVGASKAK